MVYKITCNLCQQSYIGETVQPITKRTTQNLSSQGADSAYKLHHREEHPDAQMDFAVTIKGNEDARLRS